MKNQKDWESWIKGRDLKKDKVFRVKKKRNKNKIYKEKLKEKNGSEKLKNGKRK